MRAVPSRHGVHLPHDSRVLNASSVRTAPRTAAASPSATTPPVPGLTAPRGISGSSNWRGCTTLPEGPPITTARTGVSAPPPISSISVRSVHPTSISTTPGRRRCPERPKSLVPRPPPSAAKAAPPRATIGTTAKSVSTLLMTVGLPKRPDSTGKGGRVRGIARCPSIDSSSAVSSPSTKPPAPRRISTPSDRSEPSTRSPISPHWRAWPSATASRSAATSASPWI